MRFHSATGETAAGHGLNFIKRRVKRVAEQIKSVSDKASPREAFERFIVCSGPLSAGKIKHPNDVLQAQTVVVRVEIISTASLLGLPNRNRLTGYFNK